MKLTALSHKYARSLSRAIVRCGITDDSLTVSMRNTLYQVYAKLYFDLKESDSYLQKEILPNLTIFKKPIKSISELPKPIGFDKAYFCAALLRKSIYRYSLDLITCSVKLDFKDFIRDVNINIVTQKNNHGLKNEVVIYKMLQWIIVLGKQAKPRCGKQLTIYYYDTPYLKHFPNIKGDKFDVINVNSAFADICPQDGNIVIFRREEWLKVFIHECFHLFGLDFASIDDSLIENKLRSIYGLNIDYNPTEAYAETWARLLNLMSIAYHGTLASEKSESKRLQSYIDNLVYMTQVERVYSTVQAIRVLSSYGLDYETLLSSDKEKAKFYKEGTSVFAYFVETAVFMINFEKFISFCVGNNLELFQFRFTAKVLKNYKTLINKLSKASKTRETFTCVSGMIPNIILKDNHLRMTIMELE